uniref:RL domain-containing protein n=1 Tax=Monopterus albus TaxID=43700 RepID=A0A3Q3K9L0_MONAL
MSMRNLVSFQRAMALSFAVYGLHARGRGILVNCFQNIDTFLCRCIGTNAVVARNEATRKDETDEKDERKPLHAVRVERQEQAERSVLISCHSGTNEKKFLKYLSRHGVIKKYFFYESYGVYAVVEFANRESVASLFEEATIPSVSNDSIVPFKSRLLSLRNLSSVDSLNKQSDYQCQPQTTIPINELIQKLSREESIDHQMTSLTEAYQLTEENSRLRFLVCSLLKDIAVAYFPECTIKPFGSSVNGFGKLGCDLDMFLDLDGIHGWNVKMPKSGLSLEFQMKRANSERGVTQSILSVVGECVDQFEPGCVGVQKILNARCPLVRFSHQPSGFQCDLTANNRVAMKSTELLYLYGELDPRTRRPPIIPTLDHLRELAGPADKSVIEGNDCTFVSDFSKIQLQTNTETLERLLCEFFDFYATFAFSKMSINIRKGKAQNKPEVAPLHIQNPFETSLNVSKNVNTTQLQRFVALCQESSWLLHQSESNMPRDGETATPWGLATLLLPSQVTGIKSCKKRRQEPASERIRSLLESLKGVPVLPHQGG